MTTASWGLLVVFCSSLAVFHSFVDRDRRTSLAHAVVWALFAWIAWIITIPLEPPGSKTGPWVYLALSLTGCASIAVLGAAGRRQHVERSGHCLPCCGALTVAEAAVKQGDLHFDVCAR